MYEKHHNDVVIRVDPLAMFFFCDFHLEKSSSTDGWIPREDVQQNFPLAAVCINITKMVMDALVANQLSSLEGCVPPGMSCEGLGGL
jgi:hypothetical protein